MKSLQKFLTESMFIFEDMTDAQESATCVIFNEFVKNRKKGDFLDENNKNGDAFVNEILNKYYTNIHFKKEWLFSFARQVNKLVNFLESSSLDPSEYYMERFGGSKESSYEFDSQSLWEEYDKLTTEYTKLMGTVDNFSKGLKKKGDKNNWDPTDVILYKKSLKKQLSSIFNSSANDIKNVINADDKDKNKIIDKVIKRLRYIYGQYGKPFIGLSLKQLEKKGNVSLEYYNSSDNDNITIISIEKGSPFITNTRNNLTVLLKAHYKFENVVDYKDIENPETYEGNTIIDLELRRFGSTGPAIDIKLTNGPAMGKCPVRMWRFYLNEYLNDVLLPNLSENGLSVESNGKTYSITKAEIRSYCGKNSESLSKIPIEKLVILYKSYLDSLSDDEKKAHLAELVQAAAKDIPKCLPFVIIH